MKNFARTYAVCVAAAAVALSAATVVVLTAGSPHGAVVAPALTPQEAANKAAICLQFNQNVQMPLAVIPAASMSANCPGVSL